MKLGFLIALFIAGFPVAPALSAQAHDSKITFEVASVKVTPSQEADLGIVLKCENGRFTFRRGTLTVLVSWAYDVRPTLLSVPEWMVDPSQPRYDIDAKADGAVPEAQVRLMLQNLLADRFKLALHHEVKESVQMVIRAGKKGNKLKESPPPGPEPVRAITFDREHSREVFRGATVTQLLSYLAATGSGNIYDQTGLTGRYDFVLDYGNYIDPSEANPVAARAAARLEAIRSELGLEIVNARIPVDMLVIDHADKRPVEN